MIGTVLGNRYEIISEIGSGGMARVYKARDRYLQRMVAIKVLKDEFREDTEFLKRFDTEAQAAASMAHPNIVQIYDVGRDNNRYYIVMEYVDGITLKEYITKKGSLDWREAVNISIQICGALSKAHSRNIIHRDIKPHNIIMTSDGVPKVADFGIARSVSNETATMKVDTVGSVHYSSPEQVRGGYTDEQSDIYSIGVTIFEMVTGKLPFDGETPVSVALKHIQDDVPVPSSIKRGLPRALDDIILTAMAKSRQDRYGSVSELINDLENVRTKPVASSDIVLPNIKRENKYDTIKIEKLGDEDLSKKQLRASSSHRSNRSSINSGRNSSGGSGRKLLMPTLYFLLIATIIGSIVYFISTVLGELTTDPEERPKDFTVGSYVNRNIDEVLQELKLAEVEPQVKYEPNETVPENIIINQEPAPDYTMKIPGLTKLVLTVSQGAEMVEIPKVKWEDHNEMKYHLQDELGLVVEEKPEYNEEIAANLCIKTEPRDGEKVKKGTKVILYWSMGPEKEQVVVPNLIDRTYDQAVKLLTDSKLKLGTVHPEGREGYQGVVIDQLPKAGETVAEDTPVEIFFEESSNETGDNTPPIGGTNKTIQIDLPQGYNFGDTVRLRVFISYNVTGDEELIRDQNLPTNEFPRAMVIEVPKGGGITVRVFINDIIVFNQSF